MPSKQVEDAYNARKRETGDLARKRAQLGVQKTSRNWNHNKFLESLYGKRVIIGTVGDDAYYRGELICHDSFTMLIKVDDGTEVLIGKGAGVTITEAPRT